MLRGFLIVSTFLLTSFSAVAAEIDFLAIKSLSEMKSALKREFPVGTPAGKVRSILVSEGGAKRFAHPEFPRVEKYLFDINLCRVYIWRWNVSADYDEKDHLVGLYLNGEVVVGDRAGTKGVRPISNPNAAQAIIAGKRARPQADRGERSLAYIALDRDTSSRQINDLVVVGTGPSRADPRNLGTAHTYSEVALWRSIFDGDTSPIAAYPGKCP